MIFGRGHRSLEKDELTAPELFGVTVCDKSHTVRNKTALELKKKLS